MSEYKIGYYYHNADSRGFGVHLLLTFDGTRFSFRIIDSDLLPDIKNCKEPYNKKYPTFSLANPVVYKEHFSDSHDAIIDELVFLKFVPIREKEELCNEGYEIYAPFIMRQIISNPCLSNLVSICNFSGDLILESSIYFNGVKVFNPVGQKGDEQSITKKNITLFNHLVVSRVVIKRIIDECSSFEKYASFLHNPYHHYNHWLDKTATHDKEIDLIIQYVNGLSITDIIDSISADITQNDIYYRGEIDGSYSKLNIRIPDSYTQFRYDCYLSALLRGHDFSRDVIYKAGPVDSQELYELKADLKSRYSPMEHVACLLAEWQSYAFHCCYYKRYWIDYLSVIDYALDSYFHLDTFTGQFNSPFKKKYNKELEESNLYHNTERNVAIFNNGLKTITACNLNGEKYERFYSDLLVNIVFAQHAIVCHDLHYNPDYPSGIWHNDNLSFNCSFRDMRVWPPNLNNGIAITYSIRFGNRAEDY